MAIDSACIAGHVGSGGEWNVLRGDVAAHPQPGDYAAPAAVSRLHSGGPGNGGGHDRGVDRRELGALLHRVASDLRCSVYYCLSGVVRNDLAGRMKRLFPILSILTAIFLAYALYQALRVAPTDALQGDVY